MPRKFLIIVAVLIMFSATVVCSVTGSEPTPEADAAAVEPTATHTPEPTQAPIEEDIEVVNTPTSTPEPTPAPEPTATPTEEVVIALVGQEAYNAALEEALAWQSDAVLIEMQTSILGPLDADGTSDNWAVKFWSASSQEINPLNFFNGRIQTSPIAIPNEQRVINDLDAVIFDTKAIYDQALASGGQAYVDAAYMAMASLTPYPLDFSVPTWYVNYTHPENFTVGHTVIIDARSGEVIQAITIAEP